MPSPHEWYGCIPDVLDHRDLMFAAPPDAPAPAMVDLRPWLCPVMDQGPLGSCTANAVTGAARYHIIRRGTTYDFDMSRLQLYYDSRALEGTIRSDSGAQIRDVIKTLAAKGCGHEELWPYDVSRYSDTPPQEVYDDAVQYEALTYKRVSVSASGIKSALAAGHPVIIGISIYESFESVGSDGMVPMPAPSEMLMGGHALLVAGYGQKPGYFTVRNSWGADWGDGGNCYMPQDYLGSWTYGADYWALDLFGTTYEQKAGTA
jgi:C1A family cysteine protease